jgi:dimethylhistidine N-methyltransferase
VELGSGFSVKTRLLIETLYRFQNQVEYIPIDISEILMESCKNLQSKYKNLKITGIINTYEGGLQFLKEYDRKPNLIAFLGSSFGNFTPKEGRNFLQKINNTMKENDLFLIGLDLVKEKSILEKAYNDSHGITAEFNLNMLMRINEELEGNFDLRKYSHHSIYNDDEQRIEMYLRSHTDQVVTIQKANLSIRLTKDELVHTEYSYKYTMDQIYDMLVSSGFRILKVWQDKKKHFAVVLSSRI